MDEKTLKALEALATKLGTTAEHMWGVLLRQAPISGGIGLLSDALLIFMLYFAWKKLLKVEFSGFDADIKKGGAYGLLAFVSFLGGIAVLGGIQLEVAALANPEYWALMQVLRK